MDIEGWLYIEICLCLWKKQNTERVNQAHKNGYLQGWGEAATESEARLLWINPAMSFGNMPCSMWGGVGLPKNWNGSSVQFSRSVVSDSLRPHETEVKGLLHCRQFFFFYCWAIREATQIKTINRCYFILIPFAKKKSLVWCYKNVGEAMSLKYALLIAVNNHFGKRIVTML